MAIFISVSIIITLLNFIIVLPLFLKEIKEDPKFKEATLIIFISFFIPILNGILLFLVLKDEYPIFRDNRKKKKFEKKHPELVSLNILKDIHNIYFDKIANIKDNDSKKTLIIIENKLNYLVDILEAKHIKSEYSRILSLYELTLALIVSTIKESEQINAEITNEVLLVSKDSIEQIFLEVQQLENIEVNLENKSNEVIRKSLIDKIKEDQEYHRRRTGNTI